MKLAQTASVVSALPDAPHQPVSGCAHHFWGLLKLVSSLSLYETLLKSLGLEPLWVARYVEELSKLQDAMPADSLEQVERLLTKELGATWRQQIELHCGPVLGSATIAQVHKATFRIKGQEVLGVIKVQHAGVEEKVLVDVRASVLVGRRLWALVLVLIHGNWCD